MNCDVVVTYCWNRVGYNIVRSLSSHNISVVVGDTSRKNICSLSKFVKDSFVYADPFTQEDQFIKDILHALDKYKPKVLMPTHDEALVIAKHIEKLPSNIIIAAESFDKLHSLSNKFDATLVAQSVGVPCPAFIHTIENVTYPIVIKTRYGNSAKGVFIPHTQKEADEILSKYNKDEILIQEFFKGKDYSVDCVRYNGFFQASCYKALVTKTDGGGTSTQRIIVNMPHLIWYSQQILDKVNYKGVCGLDFKVNENTGKAVFIEVNTRFTGGIATPIAAGFDIPYIYYELLTKSTYNKLVSIKEGTKTKWILGDIIALITKIINRTLKKEEFYNIVKLNFDAYDDFYKDDLKAFWGELLYYFMKLVKNRKLNP